MHILYTDESEAYPPGESHPRYFILAGISVYETGTDELSRPLNEIAARFATAPSGVELHGNPMHRGDKHPWNQHNFSDRCQAIKDALSVLASSHYSNRVFAIVVEKDAVDNHPMNYAFEQLATRFDYYLGRLIHRTGRPHRGMMLFDESTHERAIQSAATDYRGAAGHQWGHLKYFAEVPAFMDSQSSRLIQLADLVAYALNRKFSRNDDTFYNIIEPRFDSHEGKTHGLHIRTVRPAGRSG